MTIVSVLMLVAVLAIGGLAWAFLKARSTEWFTAVSTRRKPTARITSMAQLVDGRNHIPVALTLEADDIYYERPDLEARLEIARMEEVQYDTEQGTGRNILRLRAHGQRIEFILEPSLARQWAVLLPAHRIDEPGMVHSG